MVLLPIVQVDLPGSGSQQKTRNALLDSGAEINLIGISIAKDLRLRGKNIIITITTVGKQEEELRMKMYQVCMRLLYYVCCSSVVPMVHFLSELVQDFLNWYKKLNCYECTYDLRVYIKFLFIHFVS